MKENIMTPIHLKDILFPCVYFLHYKQKIVYIGSTENHYKKIAACSESLRIFDTFSIIKFDTIQEATEAAKQYILEHSPKYNPGSIVKYKKLCNNSIIVNKPFCKIDLCIENISFHIPYFKSSDSFIFENSTVKGYFREDVHGNYKGKLVFNTFTYWFHGRNGNSTLTLDTKSVPKRKGIVTRKVRDNSYTYTPQKQVGMTE